MTSTGEAMINTSEASRELVQLRSQGTQGTVQLFERYRTRLARMVVFRLDARIMGKVDVEDILQDACMEASRRIEDFLDRPSVPFFVWLRQITSQVLIDMHRRYLGAQMRDVHREMSLDQGDFSSAGSAFLLAQLAGSLTSPSQGAVRNEMLDELRTALEELEEIDREVLILRHLEELNNNEVAEILGIDKYAASKRYVRALKRLSGAMSVQTHSSFDS
ncbi:MAG: sigma-70 family RNA polymerase sigma factor [Planctomycetota bacterium]